MYFISFFLLERGLLISCMYPSRIITGFFFSSPFVLTFILDTQLRRTFSEDRVGHRLILEAGKKGWISAKAEFLQLSSVKQMLIFTS